MEERKNNRSVERQLKEALKVDRARIQVGHISQFGLMEMSRQRMRSSLIESSMSKCNYCNGLGRVSSVSSQSVQIIRAIEQDLIDNGRNNISLQTNHSLTDYLLNKKRRDIFEIEQKYNISITIVTEQLDEEKIYNINHHPIETAPMAQSTPLSIDSVYDEKKPEEDSQDEETTDSKNRKQIKNTKKQQNRKNTKTRSLSKSKSATEDENEGTKKESKEKPKGTRKKQPVKKEVVESKTINSDKKEDNDTKTKDNYQ